MIRRFNAAESPGTLLLPGPERIRMVFSETGDTSMSDLAVSIRRGCQVRRAEFVDF